MKLSLRVDREAETEPAPPDTLRSPSSNEHQGVLRFPANPVPREFRQTQRAS